MQIERNNLDDLKNKNPFKVPDGYMQNLTQEVMNRLPEKPVEEARKVTLADRFRPWIYMAAMFAGLGLFFKLFVAPSPDVIQTDEGVWAMSENYSDMREAEDEDYLDFIEAQYAGVLLAEEWKYFD